MGVARSESSDSAPGQRKKRWTQGLAVAVLVAVGSLVTTAELAAAGPANDGVTIEAFVDDRPVDNSGSNNAIALGEAATATVTLAVTNDRAAPLDLERVRLEGTAFGVPFLSYDTALPVTIDARSTETIGFSLPLNDIVEQAVGLIPASITVFDGDGAVAQQDFTVEVLGSGSSLFATLGKAIAGITAVWLLLNVWLISQRRLPPNRILRGFRLAVVGVGAGLTAVIALAAYRVLAPYPSLWRPIVVIPGIAAFLLGFASPGVLKIEDDEVDLAIRQRASAG